MHPRLVSLAASAALLLALGAAASADEFNPQPDPPGFQRIKLADARFAMLTPQNQLELIGAHGKLVSLPPGPCRLADGKTVTLHEGGGISPDDLSILKSEKRTTGAM